MVLATGGVAKRKTTGCRVLVFLPLGRVMEQVLYGIKPLQVVVLYTLE